MKMVKVDITYTMGNDCATAKDCVTTVVTEKELLEIQSELKDGDCTNMRCLSGKKIFTDLTSLARAINYQRVFSWSICKR